MKGIKLIKAHHFDLKILSLGFLLSLCVSSIYAQSQKKPNIIIILADDLGYGDIYHNGGWIETPNIDRLTREGLRFTDFHTSGTVCSPTRAGFLTGLYQYRVGVPGVVVAFTDRYEHKWGLDPNAITFPELLKKEEYTTAIFGKWHLGYTRNFNPLHYGFDQFKGYVSGQIDYQSHIDLAGNFDWWNGLEKKHEAGYTTHLITRNAIDFIKENKDRPFCLYVAHQAVHSPFQAPNDPSFREPGVTSWAVPLENQVRGKKETFKLMLQEMDKGIGQILKTLDQTGLADNTFIFFFSDNGGSLSVSSNAPFRGGKGQVWEGGHHVPAIAWWPGKIKPGTVTDELCISLDIMPTILDFTGASKPKDLNFDGINLSGLLINGESLGRRQLFWSRENYNQKHGYAVRDGNWKLVGSEKGASLLFDLSKDKAERNDLSVEYPGRVKEMQEAYNTWKQNIGVDFYFKNSNEN